MQKNHKPYNISEYDILRLRCRFLPLFIILILKQDLTVYTLFILRGGNNMRNYFPLHFQLDVYNFCNSVLKKLYGQKVQQKYQTYYFLFI